jgi:pSer/pThr/pTyr-binding forkhead associated (FHA) protein
MSVVKEYLQQAHSLDRDTFVDRNPEPFLVRQQKDESIDPRNEYRSTLKMKVDRERQVVRIEPLPPSPNDSVIPLDKTERNSFASKVLVGRTETNDIVIPHLTVSKHHAFFARDGETLVYSVTDTGSTNGSKLNGQALAPKEPHALTDGDQVSFGDIKFVYYSPGGFYDLLCSLSALR